MTDRPKPPFCWCHDEMNDATLEEPQEGDQGTVTLDELFYLLSRGGIGTRPADYDSYDHENVPHGTTQE